VSDLLRGGEQSRFGWQVEGVSVPRTGRRVAMRRSKSRNSSVIFKMNMPQGKSEA
jgi:hypothetical protein